VLKYNALIFFGQKIFKPTIFKHIGVQPH